MSIFVLIAFILIVLYIISENDPTVDWLQRHGHATALSVALKEAPDIIFQQMPEKTVEVILANTNTDRVGQI